MSKWAYLPGYPHIRVSDDGQVWSDAKRRMLDGTINNTGHRAFCIGPPRISLTAGAMMLMAFIGPRPDGMECCHNDGNPRNDKLDNLRWGTRKDNIADAIRHGTHSCLRRGEDHNGSKLSFEDVTKLREEYNAGHQNVRLLANKYGVDYTTAWKIIKRVNNGKPYRVDR